MKLLATIREHDVFPERVSPPDESSTDIRKTARLVLVDYEGLLAAIHYPPMEFDWGGVVKVQRDGYMLPGGGVEQGETLHEALVREALEETGCEIAGVVAIGQIVQYKLFGEELRLQEETVYFARVFGEKGAATPTEEEIKRGATLEWLSFGELRGLVEKQPPSFSRTALLVALSEAERYL